MQKITRQIPHNRTFSYYYDRQAIMESPELTSLQSQLQRLESLAEKLESIRDAPAALLNLKLLYDGPQARLDQAKEKQTSPVTESFESIKTFYEAVEAEDLQTLLKTVNERAEADSKGLAWKSVRESRKRR